MAERIKFALQGMRLFELKEFALALTAEFAGNVEYMRSNVWGYFMGINTWGSLSASFRKMRDENWEIGWQYLQSPARLVLLSFLWEY
jgi:hypothetical protein